MLILVVEDDPFIALHLEDIIVSHVGARVIFGASIGATRGLMSKPFDLAFLDVELPDGTTYGLADELRRRHTPFAFVSGSAPRLVPEPLRSAPFIAKPFSRREIVQMLDNLWSCAARDSGPRDAARRGSSIGRSAAREVEHRARGE
jgi:DNA-binding response OmpR family regulator